MAALDEFTVFRRKTDLHPHRFVPAIGNGGEVWIKRRAQLGDQRGQRVGEVLVFALPETVLCHDHAASEERVVRVKRSQGSALLRRDQALDHRAALRIEIAGDSFPFNGLHSKRSAVSAICTPSLCSSSRLRLTPQR